MIPTNKNLVAVWPEHLDENKIFMFPVIGFVLRDYAKYEEYIPVVLVDNRGVIMNPTNDLVIYDLDTMESSDKVQQLKDVRDDYLAGMMHNNLASQIVE